MNDSIRTVVHRVRDRFDIDVDRTTAVVAAMLGLDAVWWLLMYTGRVPMPGMEWLVMSAEIPMAAPGAMERGVFHVGTLEAVVGYAIMWGVMMWAMMHPAMTRFSRTYADSYRGTALGALRVLVVFFVSYYAVWMASAVVPLAFDAVLPGGIYGLTRAHTHLVVGGVLVLAGGYQLTAFKRSLLRSCCVAVPPHTETTVEALRNGLHHGVRCVLTCFGFFFLVMPVFGEMNLVWMIALTGVVTVERLPAWGEEIAVGTGLVSILAGVVVLVARPDLPVVFTM